MCSSMNAVNCCCRSFVFCDNSKCIVNLPSHDFQVVACLQFSLCNLGVLCASVVNKLQQNLTTETQSPQRKHREFSNYAIPISGQPRLLPDGLTPVHITSQQLL